MLLQKIVRCTEIIRWKKLGWKKIGKCHIGRFFSVLSPECMSIGDDFSFGDRLRLQAWRSYKGETFNPSITIGNHVSVMENCQISCCKSISIGDGCLFGANVFVTDNFHGNNSEEVLGIPPIDRCLFAKGPVVIGKNVWVGRNVCIMPDVTIGDGAVIGANAVVTHSIPAHCVAAGVPARIIKTADCDE